MKNRYWTTTSTTMLCAFFLATVPALASDQTRTTVKQELSQHGITLAHYDSLTDTQLSQIKLILDTTAPKTNPAEMVNKLISYDSSCLGGETLRTDVKYDLGKHKIEIKNFDDMSGSELAVLRAVLMGDETSAAKQAQVERIVKAITPAVSGSYLTADTESCLKGLDTHVALDKLTPKQMLRIQSVAAGTETAAAKRSMIDKVVSEG